ncbi:uncharacterized protein LOC130724714 [Lotus japonicus]|uniref:uncharacterized protein LOC130724714 n=1 Tax=Lotus japonicus TaxID=34305 RepID=UPI0025831023|nr:uncharacterized protein LOC130724714 [Lotus japonicus]
MYVESRFPRFLVVIEKFEPHGLEINSTHVIFPDPPASFGVILKLLESNNELFYIGISLDMDRIISIDVHRLDFSQMVWEKVKSIRDRVFFLSGIALPFTCQAINPETDGGLIYLTFSPKNFLYIYNIEDNSLVMGQTFSNLPKWRYGSLWFMPDRRMTHSIQEERGRTHSRGGDSSFAIHSNETRDRASNSCAFSFENIHDYLHFRATNNIFRLRAPVPFQRRSLSMSSFDLSCSPLFVFFEQEKFLTFVHPKHGINFKYNMTLPEDIQGGCEICYSKDGWLLLAVNTFCNMFFNPFTKEVKELAYGPAPEQRRRDILSLGFSHPPTSSECVIVELRGFTDMTVHTTCLGEEEWEEVYFEESKFIRASLNPCFHNGAFYYLNNDGKLGFVNVGDEDIYWEECEKPDAPRCARTDYYKCYLVECNGSLLSVFEGYLGNWVRVFKLDETDMQWVKVNSLENHMLFVGNQSFSAVANIPGMENKIYFPRFHGDYIVFYSLDTGKYHTFESTKVVDFHCMREQLNSSWILPRWR